MASSLGALLPLPQGGGHACQHEDQEAAAPDAALLDMVWSRLEALLPSARRKGRPYAHDRRMVLTAIMSVMQTGCAWHTLPSSFPPWQTVYAQFAQHRDLGYDLGGARTA